MQPSYPPTVDPWAQTQPLDTPDSGYNTPRGEYQRPEVVYRRLPPRSLTARRSNSCCSQAGCLPLVILLVLLLAFLLAPLRTNVLLLGIDYAPGDSNVGRSDTIILTTFIPLKPYVGVLSIPRDLWVNVPGFGENRINTAHFFAEGQNPGSGPREVMDTIKQNFGVDVHYYLRIRFKGFKDVVDAMGGVDVNLPEEMAGYPPGRYHLTGNKALAFVRQRAGSDDFFRMEHGQLLLKSVFRQMLSPLKWPRLPGVLIALSRSVDTNLPIWQWPRLGLALLRAGPDGIDNRTITREMTTSFTTDQGAQVLLPDWTKINPTLMEIFGQ